MYIYIYTYYYHYYYHHYHHHILLYRNLLGLQEAVLARRPEAQGAELERAWRINNNNNNNSSNNQ